LKPGLTFAQAQSQLDAYVSQLSRMYLTLAKQRQHRMTNTLLLARITDELRSSQAVRQVNARSAIQVGTEPRKFR
jgi:hypothetical protein